MHLVVAGYTNLCCSWPRNCWAASTYTKWTWDSGPNVRIFFIFFRQICKIGNPTITRHVLLGALSKYVEWEINCNILLVEMILQIYGMHRFTEKQKKTTTKRNDFWVNRLKWQKLIKYVWKHTIETCIFKKYNCLWVYVFWIWCTDINSTT